MSIGKVAAFVLSSAVLSACGADPSALAPSSAPRHATEPSGAPPPSSAAAPPAPVSEAPAPPPAPPPLHARLVNEIDAPIVSFALGDAPHAAALGPDRLWMHDARGWRSEPLPASLTREPAPRLSIFLGRDHQPRIAGQRGEGASAEPIYLRYRHGKLERDPAEIGRLGGGNGELVAVLGAADPEILCRPSDVCIAKSVKGWKTVDAPPDVALVAIDGGRGFAVAGASLLLLADAWTPKGPPGSWTRPSALFVLGDEAWVLEPEPARVHALAGQAWSVTPSPVGAPRAMWGSSRETLWLAGDGGLARFDGRAWRLVADAPGPIVTLTGSEEGVWIAGAHGLDRVEDVRD